MVIHIKKETTPVIPLLRVKHWDRKGGRRQEEDLVESPCKDGKRPPGKHIGGIC